MRYLVLDPPQPEYDTMKFDYDRDTRVVERWSKLADAKEPDLSKFRKSGGKLIMTYGWADQILQPLMGVKYYEAVVAKNGKDTPSSFGSSWCRAWPTAAAASAPIAMTLSRP